jgi:O-antigen/teichoic acid export membrane protein
MHTFRSERFRRLFKESFWIVLGQAAAVVGSLIGVRLLTELLDPAAYGELALGMAVATLVNQTVLGPLGNGVTRFYAPAQEQGDLVGYLNAVRQLVLSATGIIALMILLTVAGLLVAGRTEWIAIAIAAIIFATLSGYNAILSGIQNAARQRAIVALHQGMESWARFLVAAGLLLWLGATSMVAMVGYAMAVLLVIGSQYVFFNKIAPKNVAGPYIEGRWREQMLKYSWPFASWGIFSWSQIASDRWALEFFASTREVGLYAVLFQLGYQPVSLATGMAMQLLSPVLYQRAGDASDGQRNANVNNLSWRLIWFSMSVTGASFLVTLLFHTQIFGIFVAKEYASISYLLPWMVLAGGVFAAGQVMALNLMSQMKTHAMVVTKIATAILGVLLNFAGAYFFGIAGIVLAGVLFSILYSVWMAMLSKRTAAS